LFLGKELEILNFPNPFLAPPKIEHTNFNTIRGVIIHPTIRIQKLILLEKRRVSGKY